MTRALADDGDRRRGNRGSLDRGAAAEQSFERADDRADAAEPAPDLRPGLLRLRSPGADAEALGRMSDADRLRTGLQEATNVAEMEAAGERLGEALASGAA